MVSQFRNAPQASNLAYTHGSLTCRERRVKCDDGKPTCVRCSKSDRICRYAQVNDQRHVTGPGADYESTRAQSDSREERVEVCAGRNGTSDLGVAQEAPHSSQEQQPSSGPAPYFQATAQPLLQSPFHTTRVTQMKRCRMTVWIKPTARD